MDDVLMSSSQPFTVRDLWIPMRDGVRLAGRVWLPEGSEVTPVPAVLEYLPYRRRDATAVRDATTHPYFATSRFASLRVDMRGSGESEGILHDEYLALEQQDAVDVLAWLEEQPWCTGRVGMYGKSWGGFNGLQVAAETPPQLGAVISVYSTDDRYHDDIHLIGGAQWANANVSWATTMLALNAQPPDPLDVGEGWRDIWMERLEETVPWIDIWLEHQRLDDYWRHASVTHDLDSIRCPVYMVGGWADVYPTSALRMAERHTGPLNVLIGPWGHVFPHDGRPGPAIGWLQECVRFFDAHLRPDQEEDDTPRVRVWMQEHIPAETTHDERPGRWVVEPTWPPLGAAARELFLGIGGRLTGSPAGEAEVRLAPDLTHGVDASIFVSYGFDGEMAGDQRAEDGRCLAFDSEPMDLALEILGVPELVVTVVPQSPVQQVVARLCDVDPAGRSSLVTFAVLNLTRAESHSDPQALTPGEPIEVVVPFRATGYSFAPGHRIRLAVSSSYWPWVWPAPTLYELVLSVGADSSSRIRLPVRAPRPEDESVRAFEEPVRHSTEDVGVAVSPPLQRSVTVDPVTGDVSIEMTACIFSEARLKNGTVRRDTAPDRFTINRYDPTTATARSERTILFERDDWDVRIEASGEMTCDAGSFHTTNTVKAFESGRLVFERSWNNTVARDLA